jgi:hypothetical protein
MLAKRFFQLIPAAGLLYLLPQTHAAPVTFSFASATFDQNFAGGVGAAADGDINSQGWAVFGGQNDPQSALFATNAPLTSPNLNFGLYFTSGFGAHTINDFRISATNDPNPSAGSVWTQLPITGLSALFPGTALTNLVDNHVRATGNTAGLDVYGGSAPAPFPNITGFLLETFPVANSPGAIPTIGHAPNGNFVLSEFAVDDSKPFFFPKDLAYKAFTKTNGTLYAGLSTATLTNGDRNDLPVHGDGPGGNTGNPEAPGFHYDINLGTTIKLDDIDIFPRQDGCCPDRLTNYRVSVHKDLNGQLGNEVWHADLRTDGSVPDAGPTPPEHLTADLDQAGVFQGQWIRIESLDNPVPAYALQVNEVEVHGTITGPPIPNSWKTDGVGDWNNTANWAQVVPNAPDAQAHFLGAFTAGHTIYTDTPVTVGDLKFDNANTYLITGLGTLTLQTTIGHASVAVLQGSHKINLPLIFANDTDVNIANGAVLTLADPVTFAAGITVTKDGAGLLSFISTQNAGAGATLKILGGTVNIDQNGGSNLNIIVGGSALNFNAPQRLASLSLKAGGGVTLKTGNNVMKLNSLSFDGAPNAWQGKLDLVDNDLVVQATAATRQATLDTISSQIASARNTLPDKWQGQGITSSAAAVAAKGITGLAVVLNEKDAGGTLYSDFDGQHVDTNSVLVKYTYNGDMDLNGRIDSDDYFQIDNGFARHLTGYRNGDLDFSGTVDADDYFLIDNAFLNQNGIVFAGGVAANSAAVPEPGVASMFVLGLLLGSRRRRVC